MARLQSKAVEVVLSLEEWEKVATLIEYVADNDICGEATKEDHDKEYRLWSRADDVLEEVNDRLKAGVLA
jgi:hypothetical protein